MVGSGQEEALFNEGSHESLQGEEGAAVAVTCIDKKIFDGPDFQPQKFPFTIYENNRDN